MILLLTTPNYVPSIYLLTWLKFEDKIYRFFTFWVEILNDVSNSCFLEFNFFFDIGLFLRKLVLILEFRWRMR